MKGYFTLQCSGQWHSRKHGGPRQIGRDHRAPFGPAIDERAEQQRRQCCGGDVGDGEQCHRGRLRLQHQHRHPRDRESAHQRTEGRDHLGSEDAVHFYSEVPRVAVITVDDRRPEPGLVDLPHSWNS